MSDAQNKDILLHAGRLWSEETKQRARKAKARAKMIDGLTMVVFT